MWCKILLWNFTEAIGYNFVGIAKGIKITLHQPENKYDVIFEVKIYLSDDWLRFVWHIFVCKWFFQQAVCKSFSSYIWNITKISRITFSGFKMLKLISLNQEHVKPIDKLIINV